MTVNKNGKVLDSRPTDAINKDLPEIIGKSMADRALNEESGKIAGEDFTVGGEGMKGFYDEILPHYLNKYGKKWGATVGTLNLDLASAALGDLDRASQALSSTTGALSRSGVPTRPLALSFSPDLIRDGAINITGHQVR